MKQTPQTVARKQFANVVGKYNDDVLLRMNAAMDQIRAAIPDFVALVRDTRRDAPSWRIYVALGCLAAAGSFYGIASRLWKRAIAVPKEPRK